MSKEYEVLVVVDVQNIQNKDEFDKYLKKEGLVEVEGEAFAYIGTSHTPIFHTRAFIWDTIKKALKKSGSFDECKIVLQLSENPVEGYRYDKDKDEFEEINFS